MRSSQFLKTLVFLFGISLAVQSCATMPDIPASPSESVLSSLGKVGVVSAGPALDGKVLGPIGAGNEAAKGALEGGAIGGASGAGLGAVIGLGCGPFALACVPAFAAAGAVGGVVFGGGAGGIIKGTNALPEGTATNIQAALYNAVANRDLQSELRRRVLERENAGNAHNAIDLGISKIVDPSATPDYSLFSASGVNTVLEISIEQIAFTSEGGATPTFVLSITARARLIRIPGNQLMWSNDQISFKSPAAELSLWTPKDSDLMKSQIQGGLEALAQQITEIVPVKAPETQRKPS
jgi:hypothetical protein